MNPCTCAHTCLPLREARSPPLSLSASRCRSSDQLGRGRSPEGSSSRFISVSAAPAPAAASPGPAFPPVRSALLSSEVLASPRHMLPPPLLCSAIFLCPRQGQSGVPRARAFGFRLT